MSDSTFNPPTSDPFGLTSVNFIAKPTFVDIDGDGDLDAFIGSLDGNTSFYRNISTTSSAVFTTSIINPFGLTNVVLHANPTFVDIDGDGDLDAFIGDDAGDTLFYHNTQATIGTPDLPVDPVFSTPISNPFGLTDAGNIAAPTFVDIDGDSDLDAFIGNQDNILYYQNIGNINNPVFTTPISNPFGFNAGYVASSLSFTDIDKDGDLDAFVGNFDGNTLFYRNTQTTLGTPALPVNPVFSTPPITNPFGFINVGFWAKPTFADLNGDGQLDAIEGTFNGNTLFYANNLASKTTAFIEQTPVDVANAIVINSSINNWSGATLTVQITANNTVDDGLALPTTNNGGIWLNSFIGGGTLMANETIIGTANASKVSNDGAWIFTFNADATTALVQDTARAIQFINHSNTPSTTDRTVTFTTTDSNAVSNAITQTVTVTAVPDVALSAGINPVEGSTVGTFNITLDSPAPVGGLTVNFNTLGSTATLNSDYHFALGENLTAITGNSFTIAEGATSATLNLVAYADAVIDYHETVVVNLINGMGYDFTNTDIKFFIEADYSSGSQPMSVSLGDLNNDGKLDLVTGDYLSGVITILFRNEANTFFGVGGKVEQLTGFFPVSSNTGDFNNDGKLDLAIANWNNNTVSVLLRNADNTGFNATVDYATDVAPTSVSVGDFNNDGKLDIAVANTYSNTISVLLRNADNTGFDARVDYPTGNRPNSISVGDFNYDSKLDLAVTNQMDNSISVLLRNTDNTGFDTKVDYAVGLNPVSVGVGDFNNDGKLDLVIANFDSDTVSVLLRNADSTGFDTKVDYATGLRPQSVNVGDFNNDSKIDLVVANSGNNTVSILFGNADNTGFEAKVDYAVGSYPYRVNVGDFNNDGIVDLAVLNSLDRKVSVLLTESNHTATLLIGNNDYSPTLVTPPIINYTDTAFVDNFVVVTGSLNAIDLDGNVLTYGIVGGTTYADVIDMNSIYGRLTVTKATGAYSFYPNSEAMNALSVDTTSTFTVTVSDGQLTDSKTLAINITQSGITESIGNDKLIGTIGNDVFNGLAGNDTISGLAGKDTINGGEGADKMLGGKGDDTYYVDNVGDRVIEHRWEGMDTVYYVAYLHNASYALPDNVENLIFDNWRYSGTGIGNALDNSLHSSMYGSTLYGLAGDDSLYGAGGKNGSSVLIGGKGNDSYYVNAYASTISETIIEQAGEGEDTVYALASCTLADNVENLVLVGDRTDRGIFRGTGNALNNHLTGSGTQSVLEGLGGNDNYYVGNEGTVIVEAANQGWDTVLSTTNRTLETNVEEIYLLGIANLYGYGNDQDNNLNGNAGNNILDGRAGNDFMVGRAGDDEYYVDNTGDVVKERTNEGVDTVFSSLASYKLTANVENLVLIGTANLNGTGNNLNNMLGGNNANNILKGGAGDDDVNGQAGDDILFGEAGNDYLQGINGADTLIGGLGKDINQLFETIATTDTVRIAKGDSLIDSYDRVVAFELGTGTINTSGVDKLDLDSTRIGANTAGFNGVDSGIIHSHRISNGMISFDDVNLYSQPLAITDTNLARVFSYLQANITGLKTVAFVAEGNTFVFQDGGVQDTLVELVGVTAQSINTTGLATDSIWIA